MTMYAYITATPDNHLMWLTRDPNQARFTAKAIDGYVIRAEILADYTEEAGNHD